MLKAICILPLLLLTPLLPVSTARGDSDPGRHAATTAHGLQVSLSLPRGAYPRDALVPVLVRLQNLSHRSIPVTQERDQQCTVTLPWVHVMTHNGQIVYPPFLPGGPFPHCPIIRPITLRPGQVIQKQVLLILRDRYVQAGVTFAGTRCCRDTNVVTRPLAIRFTFEPHPRAVLHVSPRAEVDIEPGSPAQKGRLYYDEGWACRFSGGSEVTTGAANWGLEGWFMMDRTFYMGTVCNLAAPIRSSGMQLPVGSIIQLSRSIPDAGKVRSIEVSSQEIVHPLIEDNGLRQVDLAGPVFPSASAVSDFLAGRRPLSYERVGKLRGVRPGSRGRAYPERRTATARGPGASPPGRRRGRSGP